MANMEEYTRTFSSFSGADIAATFNGRVIGELQALSYSVSREKAPIYTMSSADARGFARGKRGISGQLVFVQFDRDALIDEMSKSYKGAPEMMKIQQFKANMSGVGSTSTAAGLEDQILNGLKSISSTGATTYGINTWNDQMTKLGYANVNNNGGFDENNITDFYTPEYADQIMPFNITITMANEYGNRAGMEIFGVELLNEASGFSIDDVITAKAFTFVARKVKSVTPKENLRQGGSSSAGFTQMDGSQFA